MLTNRKFKDLLRKRNIVIVHFSHFATMSIEVEFPADLQHAIDYFENETRSCCALFPGHKMDLPGTVGLIYDPEIDQILSVCASDSGSSDYAGVEGSLGVQPSEDSILQSLEVGSSPYNEWRVRGSKPVGIFVTNPLNIEVKKAYATKIGAEFFTGYACITISLDEVYSAFPELSVFTMGESGLVKLAR